ncbi:MAG: hypothetical protein WC764_02505 [Candidatus Paceibacterota bacterium]|jgi:hypothetical protein
MSKIISIVPVSFFVLAAVSANASLLPIAAEWWNCDGRSNEEVVARARAILHFTDGRATANPLQPKVTVEDFLSKTGTTVAGFRAWRLLQVTESIEASAVAGVNPTTGKITWGDGKEIPIGVWVLSNEPKTLKGGEEVISVDLRCFNVYKHRVKTKQVLRWVRHHVTELQPPDRVVYETRTLPAREQRVPYYYQQQQVPVPVGMGATMGGGFGGYQTPPNVMSQNFAPPISQVFAPGQVNQQGGNVNITLPNPPQVQNQPGYYRPIVSDGSGGRGFGGGGTGGAGGRGTGGVSTGGSGGRGFGGSGAGGRGFGGPGH